MQRLNKKNLEKTATFGEQESVVSIGQCTSSHSPYRDLKHQWVEVRVAPSGTVFDRLVLFRNLKNWFGGKKIANNELDGSHYKTKNLLNIATKSGLKPIRRLYCWEIMKIF